VTAAQACHDEEMSVITRVVIRAEHADGSVREYRALNPAGLVLRFADEGGIVAQAPSGSRLVMDVLEIPAGMTAEGTSFVLAEP